MLGYGADRQRTRAYKHAEPLGGAPGQAQATRANSSDGVVWGKARNISGGEAKDPGAGTGRTARQRRQWQAQGKAPKEQPGRA